MSSGGPDADPPQHGSAADAGQVGPLHTMSVGVAGPRVAFLHGLFGQGRNWTQIARAVAGPHGASARCTLVDLPDHGRSPWSTRFSYAGYADAVAATLGAVDPRGWTLVGHSLGGKVAMALALTRPDLLDRLVVVDIAPRDYGDLSRFAGYIAAMRAMPLDRLTGRDAAEAALADAAPEPSVRAFLLQNLRRAGSTWRWQANLELFAADAARGSGSLVAGWPPEGSEDGCVATGSAMTTGPDGAPPRPFDGPTLWIVGGASAYVRPADLAPMRAAFPRVRRVTVKGAGHWVHADAPDVVVDALRRFVHSGVDGRPPGEGDATGPTSGPVRYS